MGAFYHRSRERGTGVNTPGSRRSTPHAGFGFSVRKESLNSCVTAQNTRLTSENDYYVAPIALARAPGGSAPYALLTVNRLETSCKQPGSLRARPSRPLPWPAFRLSFYIYKLNQAIEDRIWSVYALFARCLSPCRSLLCSKIQLMLIVSELRAQLFEFLVAPLACGVVHRKANVPQAPACGLCCISGHTRAGASTYGGLYQLGCLSVVLSTPFRHYYNWPNSKVRPA